jgi:ATP-dependent exoDNAse (exonuclease V) beta subunit
MMRGKNWKEGHKYWGMTREEIKAQWFNNGASVSQAGTDLHYRIECFMNNRFPENPDLPFAILPHTTTASALTHQELSEQPIAEDDHSVPEWTYFLNFIRDHPNKKPYRTEWMIYNEDLKLSGSIDMVYENEDGTLSIYDWKRCKQITKVNQYNKFAISPEICEMADSNYWHYSLQLNTYKAILEAKYNKQIRDMFLVQLHPESDEGNYVLYEVQDLSTKIQELFAKIPTPSPATAPQI